MIYLSSFVILLTIIFLSLYFKEKRTMWLGFFAIVWFIVLLIYFILVFEVFDARLAFLISAVTAIVFIVAIPLYLISFIIMLITSGIKLVRREGRAFHNFLSLASGVLIIVWTLLTASYSPSEEMTLLLAFYQFLSSVLIYAIMLVAVFVTASLLNKTFIRKKHYDYLIVLGAGLIGDRVPPLLASRIDKAIQVFQQQDSSEKPKLIFTGGKGDDEQVAEGVVMAAYAQAQGLEEKAYIIEDKAVNTYENLLFSKDLIEADAKAKQLHIAIVTNNFHVFRSLIWSRIVGLKANGIGAKTKFYFWLNALIREFIAILSMNKKGHLFVVGLLFLNACVTYLMYHFGIVGK